MKTGKVIGASSLAEMPDQDAGAETVIEVITDLPAGQPNAFYMDPGDLSGALIVLPLANQPADAPIDPQALNIDDPIQFDVQDGIHKVVLWKGRRIRQRGYSFDWMAAPSAAGFG